MQNGATLAMFCDSSVTMLNFVDCCGFKGVTFGHKLENLMEIQIIMKKLMMITVLTFVLAGCSHTHTGGFFGASNGGAAGGLTQSFRW